MTDARTRRRPRARRLALMGGLALLATAAPALATTGPTAELASGNLFMGTTKVEAGARANGSFGSTVAAPAGYHPLTSTGTILGFRVDPAECDWNDAGCVTLGDFFTPGSPYEAWGIQIGSGSPAYNSNGASGVAGAFTSADAAGASGVWRSSGAFGGAITVTQTYAIPSYAWMIDTTVELTNTSGATVDDVYFMRGLDPDNCRMESRALCDANGDGTADAAGTTGIYDTHNTIVSQGSSSTDAVVTATQANDSYLALRARGAEARVFAQNSGFSNPASLQTLWNGGNASYRSTAGSTFGDNGIYAVVHVPSIAPGATETVHIQYVVKEVPAAADFAVTVPSTGGVIDVAAHNGGAGFQGACSAPAHGTLVAEGGSARYVPAAGFSGTDSFSYSAGGPCGTVTVTVLPAAAVPTAPKASAPVTLLSTARRRTLPSGDLRVAQRLRIEGAGRYTFIYSDPATGRRVRQMPGSSVGSRKLAKRYSAPVLVTRTAGTSVTLVSVFDRALRASVRKAMRLRSVLKAADGTLSDVTP